MVFGNLSNLATNNSGFDNLLNAFKPKDCMN
jgi:hypothetical protein